ncbi:MAG: SMP-30/gluconolactonase/LRE family protein [Planctomycetales bacterium]
MAIRLITALSLLLMISTTAVSRQRCSQQPRNIKTDHKPHLANLHSDGTTSVSEHEQSVTDLVALRAKIVKLADGFEFTEGPAGDAKGNIYFTDIPNNRIHTWSAQGSLATFREDSGGANGLSFDHCGNLLICEGGNRRLTRLSMTGKVTVLADKFKGKKLNSPNDLWIDPCGGVYFTDPRYGSQENLEQDGFHVYYLPPNCGDLVRVIVNLVTPNGIIGTANGKLLYVADLGDGKTFVYRIQPDGSLSDRRQIAPEGSDGMALDERGNLYLTGSGIEVYSPQGKKIASIETPERPANITFGGTDGRTLYITATSGFYSLRMKVRGQ